MGKEPPLPEETKQWIQGIANRKAPIPENIMTGGALIAGSWLIVFVMEHSNT
jgi:hypothetical protein